MFRKSTFGSFGIEPKDSLNPLNPLGRLTFRSSSPDKKQEDCEKLKLFNKKKVIEKCDEFGKKYQNKECSEINNLYLRCNKNN